MIEEIGAILISGSNERQFPGKSDLARIYQELWNVIPVVRKLGRPPEWKK
ncbi:hypothetical protein [Streptomyces alkaliphilus]|uniref:Uncharacterized protein n=1 Tax=Streptomyces alkaliphilus TaxID=1472722 RepID=A0A7W3Y0I8_9ACTN|nr:hypothetical protein [Streptomyces alkaliphilus]MBB0243312.1 hypothetical protein [Streptomyces alkaliphilus]